MLTINVGTSLPLSGKYKEMGKKSLQGILLWANLVNSKKGIYVREYRKNLAVKLIYFDNESNPLKTASITKKLIKDKKIDILFGTYSSSLGMAVLDIASTYDRTIWNYGSSIDDITGPHVISTITPASLYFIPILKLLEEQIGLQNENIALAFASNSSFSKKVAKGLLNYAEKKRYNIYIFPFTSGNPSFADFFQTVKSRKIKVLFSVGRFEDDMAFCKSVFPYKKGKLAISTVAAATEEFKKKFKGKSEGFLAPSQWEPACRIKPDFGPTSSEFCSLYSNKYENPPDYISAQAFNMGLVIEKCIKDAGTLDDHTLRSIAQKSSFTTFYGHFNLDPLTGAQREHALIVIQWQNSKKEIIYPENYRTSTLVSPLK